MDTSESYVPDPIKRVEGATQPMGLLESLTTEQALQTLQIMEARARADAAEYEKRLVMQQFRPSRMYPVVVYHDGMRWVCSYGVAGEAYREYLPDSALGQSGVEAYGEFPEEAMQNFDALWIGNLADDLDEDEAAE